MPGVLGSRAQFARHFDAKDDPLARRRLAARVRPFLLRRTKGQVAKDLPDRIEEDLFCEIEGRAADALPRRVEARAALLLGDQDPEAARPAAVQLPDLAAAAAPNLLPPRAWWRRTRRRPSAKLDALLELLEPLIEEGHKVLVFSQFVEMLELLRAELAARDWPHLLPGRARPRIAVTWSRHSRAAEGAAVFLISLKAGGFGLNLTAASYVVLFDPWWNPAVENQAIDRTHRIGQSQQGHRLPPAHQGQHRGKDPPPAKTEEAPSPRTCWARRASPRASPSTTCASSSPISCRRLSSGLRALDPEPTPSAL